MSQENVEVVRQLFDAWNRGDYAAASALVDPAISVESLLDGPMAGRYDGAERAARWLSDFWGNFGEFHTEIGEYMTRGDDVVIAAHHYGRGKSSGVEVQMDNWQIFTVRGEKIVRYRLYTTKQEALEAAGLSK